MLVNLKELLQQSEGGVASFNCVDFDMARGCLDAAEEQQRPVVLGIASRHWEFLGGAVFVPSLLALCRESSVPVALHLDHANPSQLDILEQALKAGFTSVMIDASGLSFQENIEITRRVVQRAAEFGASTEAELGPIPGQEGVAGAVESSGGVYTDPREAQQFCAETGVDALAVAVGTAHGLYRDEPMIQQERISRLAADVSVPLVLHGATGVPDSAIREAVRRGIRKINFFSGLLVTAMDLVRNTTAPDDNDYAGLRQKLREAWKNTAAEMIMLYRG